MVKKFKLIERYEFIIIGLIYCLVFHLYFLQLPISGSLPGKVDGVFHLFVVEDLFQRLISLINGSFYGGVMFPEKSYFQFGNFSPGFFLFYFPYRLFSENYVYCFWGVISWVFILNAWALYVLLRFLKVNKVISFYSGIIFVICNFVLSNIDNLDGICWFSGILSFYFLLLYLKANKNSYLFLSSLLIGVQIYFSTYLFLISVVIWAGIWLSDFFEQYNFKKIFNLVIVSTFVLILIFPFVKLYFWNHTLVSTISNQLNTTISLSTSLSFTDLFSYHPNAIYSQFFLESKDNWNAKLHSAGIGFLLPLIGVFAIFKFKLFRFQWWVVGLFIVIALGSSLYISDYEVKLPGILILDYCGLGRFFRINIRAYYGIIFFLIICSALYFNNKSFSLKYLSLIYIAIILENISFELNNYNSNKNISYLKELNESFSFRSDDILFHFPSKLYLIKDNNNSMIDEDNQVANEYFYMFFQTLNQSKCINGITGYIPVSRYENQKLINDIENTKSRLELIRRNNLKYLVVHKYLLQEYNFTTSQIHTYFDDCIVEFENNDFIVYNLLSKIKVNM